MMRHSARPTKTNIVIEDSHIEGSDDGFDPGPMGRRHRPVTALIRRRSSKLENLVRSVTREGDFDADDGLHEDRVPMSVVGRRAASAPHRMSITSFYADSSPLPYHPETHEPHIKVPIVRRQSIKEEERRPSIRPRSTVTLERPPLIPRRQRPKTAIQLRRESAPPKKKPDEMAGDDGSDDEENSNSGSNSDSDSSLSTLESLRELKNRIDEIVGAPSVTASRSVRRGSVTSATNFTMKAKTEEAQSQMVADYVIRRRPTMISNERRGRSVTNLINRLPSQQMASEQNRNRTRGRSASLATTSVLPQRSRRATTASRQRTKSVTTIGGQTSPGVQMFESRRASIASTFRDANGSVSYQARKNLRRGSLFVDSIVIDEDYDRRGSLLPPEDILPGQRGSFEGMKRSTLSRRRSPLPEDLNIAVPDRMSVKLARERFRRIARLVLNCVKICRRSYLNIEEERSEFQSFIQVGTRSHDGDRLFFDPDYFKADKSQRLSEETKRILTAHPHNRTEKDLKYVQIALRNIKAFAEYPIRMQGRLCKAGWLETYGANRAVLRQGHPPHAFYFILSGTLIVTIFMMHGPKGKPSTQTVAFLRRGQSFGELAILNETVRASTVITKSRCELLVISVEDFQDIFMVSGGIKSVNDPDQHAFLTSLRFLTHWPIHIIPTHPKDCLFHFFATGDVLVQDSNQSDWIYIIKSGSCSVLKKLKSVPENVHSSYKRKDVCMTWNKDTTLVASIMDDKNKSPSRKKVKVNNNNRRDIPSSETSRRSSTTVSSISIKGHGSETSSVIPPITRKSQGVYLKTGSARDDGKDDNDSGSDVEKEELGEDGLPVNFVNQRRTFHTDLDIAKKTSDQPTDADKDPMFVTIQLLLKGGVFGVNNIVFPDQPSLSLISNGAECIMIRKSFYLEHAAEDTLSLLRKNEFPYPTEEQLQEKLQKHMNWNAYKDHTVRSVVFQSRAHKAQQLTSVHR
ncbi:uncharacterized protein LOC129269790 [Lytechinus pictus]|uniref:uncharacterized protein LOC129269790 n=1 Tax=Lytechinus pictus TaxID=7653 RepID=UPI0030B9E51B